MRASLHEVARVRRSSLLYSCFVFKCCWGKVRCQSHRSIGRLVYKAVTSRKDIICTL